MNLFKVILITFILSLIPSSLLSIDISTSFNLKYYIPLGNDRSNDYNKLKNRIIGKYGEVRNSNVRGHKHSGIDIQADFSETVYSIGEGTVTNIFRGFPDKTIYIRHAERLGIPFYSVYIHVEDIQVNVGELVTENTPIARIFNREELKASNFETLPHVHFEIRHDISDKGDATFASMSILELNRYCIDPLKFFKKVLKQPDSKNY